MDFWEHERSFNSLEASFLQFIEFLVNYKRMDYRVGKIVGVLLQLLPCTLLLV